MYRFAINDPHFLPHSGCNVELLINKGEVQALIGENGIGKTTLVHRIYNENAVNMTLVEQRPMDYFYDRPLARIKSMYLDAGRGKISQEHFLNYWRIFNLDKKESRLQSTLSGGESQALKLTLGLSVDRAIFVLDEPSQYLDESARISLNSIICDLRKLNKTIILIEHDLTWINFPLNVTELQVEHGNLVKGKSWTT